MIHWNGIERRETKNGLGRRTYDRSPCPFYDTEEHKCKEVESVRTELNRKLPQWVFIVFVSSACALLGIGATISGSVLKEMKTVTEKTFGTVVDVKVQVSAIEARQESLIRHAEKELNNGDEDL